MSLFERVWTFDREEIADARVQVAQHPELWDAYGNRTRHPDSPHRETSDIWLRYRDPAELRAPEDFRVPHFPVWYPGWRALPALHPIVYGLAALLRAVHIGGILITRLGPGCRVYAHDDRGAWHAEYHNTKIWLPLAANPHCYNQVCDEVVVFAPGEAWTFNNLLPHSVWNAGKGERITLICSFRTEP